MSGVIRNIGQGKLARSNDNVLVSMKHGYFKIATVSYPIRPDTL